MERKTDVDAHNELFANGSVTFSQGINQHSDLTYDEIGGKMHGLFPRAVPTDGYGQSPFSFF